DKRRPLRSYVIRAGRLTDSQRRALAAHWDAYVVPCEGELLDLSALFPHPAPVTVEIGFGMGDSLLAMARDKPEHNFLGIEVHKPGVGKLLNGIVEHDLTNIRIVSHDAKEVFGDGLAPASVDRVLLLFPDPWPKKRHHKRRLLQPAFVELVATRLRPGGHFHLATDWQNYAEHMLEVMEASPSFRNTQGARHYWQHPERPETKFERRGQRLGHGVWDLLYEKV
ncbi:MAG: tRNA (guanosine(46)-N7)-methyltransferase TrmB, partial [Pseudohongiellaceae bacterium]